MKNSVFVMLDVSNMSKILLINTLLLHFMWEIASKNAVKPLGNKLTPQYRFFFDTRGAKKKLGKKKRPFYGLRPNPQAFGKA